MDYRSVDYHPYSNVSLTEIYYVLERNEKNLTIVDK